VHLDCVTQCPDTAILAKVSEPASLDHALGDVDDANEREWIRRQWTRTQKFHDAPAKRGEAPASSACSSIRANARVAASA
jgi:pyruvate ferredoxin oxidoreductase beta subunit